jgi:cytochrome c-type biogenesis protein CcmF
MGTLGNLSLIVALGLTIYGATASVLGVRTGREYLIRSGERATLGVFLSVTLASIALWVLMMSSDFTYNYVARVTNHNLGGFYKFAAFWGGQEGSLLLWTWILTIFSALVVWQNKRQNRDMMPWVNFTMLATLLLFLVLNLLVSNPFARLAQEVNGAWQIFTPADGQGLNPLLQHPAMVIHPPVLFLGYAGFTVPFAFAVAALMTRQLDDSWIKTTRRWTIFAWFFLGIGILLGAKWAYVELGWGGYWAWDPVENASLMPWLTGTAFLHSVIVQERKGMLKIWNVWLVTLTFLLCLFGTFLTRSGVVSSVHAFAQSDIGWYFLSFILVGLAFTAWLIFSRLPYLRSDHRLDSMISRESSYLFNNLLLLGLCFAVWWGTLFPTISEAIQGVRITVGPPFFNRVGIPMLLGLLLLTGVGPLLAYRKTRLDSLRRNFALPTILALLTAAVCWFAFGITSPYPLISLGLSAFVCMTIFTEFYNGAKARQRGTGEPLLIAVINLTRRNKRRYGGYIVHIAIVMMFVGVTGSAFTSEESNFLGKGETLEIGRYNLVVDDIRMSDTENYNVLIADVSVKIGDKVVKQLHPEKRFYKIQQQPTTEVRIYTTLREDLYLIVNSTNDEGKAFIHAWINPLVSWLWIGGFFMFVGTVIVMLPNLRGGSDASASRQAAQQSQPTEVAS